MASLLGVLVIKLQVLDMERPEHHSIDRPKERGEGGEGGGGGGVGGQKVADVSPSEVRDDLRAAIPILGAVLGDC